MQGLLTRGVVVAAFAFTALPLGTASADTVCQQTNPATGVCLVWVEVPADPEPTAGPTDDGPKDSGSGASCYWDPSKQGLAGPPAGPVPCTSEYGYWSNAYNCYLKALTPPLPAGDPAWQGHEPGDGAVYLCFQPQTGLAIQVWAQDPPAGSGVGPTPREVAQLAVDQMQLSAIDIGIVPEPRPGSVGLVGMPVWMWAKATNEHTIGPATATASAGGITITATAKLLHVTWSMGDGADVICNTVGTPYKPSYGRKDSPDCGHIYKTSSAHQADDAYTVTATSSWVITWSGAGQTGTIRLDGLARSTQIRIGEAQVLVN
ncbi:hypothetical protein [Nocardioides conyzicola]|uniref:ATP/GTP-binding protein n=1 Tax=Nocardioides conyzicola TaxID=1651781 RepID=A0ABP8X2Y0_9ACTN